MEELENKIKAKVGLDPEALVDTSSPNILDDGTPD
jgi:hypothetical protein